LYLDPAQAVAHATRLLEEGASIIDVGGESTRPGARVLAPAEGKGKSSGKPSADSAAHTSAHSSATIAKAAVMEKEERQRVIPVIAEIKKRHPKAIVSIDTYKSQVARAAVEAGAEIVNDVSGFRWDPQMAKTVAQLKCGCVIMHMRGRPEEWKSLSPPGDVVLLVKRELKQWAEDAVVKGVKRDHIVVDPGFGFGKRFEENYPLLARFEEFQSVKFPLLVGTSRKSFIGRMLARNGKDIPADQRLYGTLATQTALILRGAHIIRTHDVHPAVEAARVADLIMSG
jgi:dihydropteroate synthase